MLWLITNPKSWWNWCITELSLLHHVTAAAAATMVLLVVYTPVVLLVSYRITYWRREELF